jgi:hypothetical protein
MPAGIAAQRMPPRRVTAWTLIRAGLIAVANLDCLDQESHAWVATEIETKFLRLCKPAVIGDRINGWRVCWVGGWDKCRVFFFVMVERPRPARS